VCVITNDDEYLKPNNNFTPSIRSGGAPVPEFDNNKIITIERAAYNRNNITSKLVLEIVIRISSTSVL